MHRKVRLYSIIAGGGRGGVIIALIVPLPFTFPMSSDNNRYMKGMFLNSSEECLVLQDGLHTISRVSQATEEELMDCSLDHHTAQKVINFFDKDCIQI